MSQNALFFAFLIQDESPLREKKGIIDLTLASNTCFDKIIDRDVHRGHRAVCTGTLLVMVDEQLANRLM